MSKQKEITQRGKLEARAIELSHLLWKLHVERRLQILDTNNDPRHILIWWARTGLELSENRAFAVLEAERVLALVRDEMNAPKIKITLHDQI